MSVSHCQRCHEEITVPAGLAPASEVQCPLCQDVFELAEVLSAAPPALIVLNAVPTDAAAEGSSIDGASEGIDLGAGMSAGSFSLGAATAGGEGLGELKLASDPASTFTSASAATTPGAAPRSSSRKRKSKSPVAEILKVVLGGVFGLGGGYFILLWVFGVNAVPELTNTISRFAAFAVPAKFHDPDQKSNGSSSVEDAGSQNGSANALPPLPEDAGSSRPPAETQAAVFANDQDALGGVEPSNSADPAIPDFDINSPDTVLNAPADEATASQGTAGDAAGVDVTNPGHFVSSSPRVTLAELSAPIEQAEAAITQWQEGGDGNHQQQALSAMATLGQLLAYADQENDQVKQLLPRVTKLMREFTDGKKREAWIKQTESWFRQQATDRTGPHGFLSIGKVGETSAAGDFYRTPVKLAGPAKTEVLVISETEAAAPPNGKIVSFLGTLLSDPATRIQGLEEQEQPIVLLAHFTDPSK